MALRSFFLLCGALFVISCGDGASPGTGSAPPPVPACTGNLVDLSSDVQHIHDPAIAKQDGTYYVYSSSALASFYTSPDLRTWTKAGTVFDALPQWIQEELPNPNHIGSPDIAWYDGKWVMYYQSHIAPGCNAAMGVATNVTLDPNDPEYKWDDHGLVLRSVPLFENIDIICGQDEVLFDAIDPHLFVDPTDNRPWLVFGSTLGGIFLVEIDPKTFRPTQHPRNFVLLASRPLIQLDPIIEGAYMIHRNGWYYLFFSHNRCCQGPDTKYNILVGRSRTLAGPYFDKDGVALLDEGGTLLIEREGRVIGTGHTDVYSEAGYDYLVHHGYDSTLDYDSILNVRRLDWGDDGWPVACIAAD